MKIKLLLCSLLCVPFLYSCFYPIEIMEAGIVAEKGVKQGMSSVQYFAAANTSVEDINASFIKAGKKVNLADTYRIAYGKSLKEAGPTGNTGYKFTTMENGTLLFQKILEDKGMLDAKHYILTNISTQIKNGYILVAVVHRPYDTIKVIDKYDKSTIKEFTSKDLGFYEPFRTDANGNALDTIVDWVGVPMRIFTHQKYRAVMLTLSANMVFEKQTRDDYWEAEQRWLTGQYGQVCEEQDQKTCNIMGLKKGFQ